MMNTKQTAPNRLPTSAASHDANDAETVADTLSLDRSVLATPSVRVRTALRAGGEPTDSTEPR